MSVTADRLRAECLRRRYVRLLDKPEVFPSETNWQYIIDHAMTGLAAKLYRKYLVALLTPDDTRCDYHVAALKYFPAFLAAIPRAEAIDALYSDRHTAPEAFVRLVEELQLADFDRLADIVEEGDIDSVIELLDADCPDYDFATYHSMMRLVDAFDSLPQTGRMEDRRTLLGTQRRYVCPEGHVNDADVTFCTHSDCGLDIYGLTRTQRDAINAFVVKTEALLSLLQG